jgi:hypothetical protein
MQGFGSRRWIQICIREKSWIRIKVRIQELSRLKNGAMDAHNGGVKCRPVVADLQICRIKIWIFIDVKSWIRIRITVKSFIRTL